MQYVIAAILALLGIVHYFNRRKIATLQKENTTLKFDSELNAEEAKSAALEKDLADAKKSQAEKVREFNDRVGRFLDPDV